MYSRIHASLGARKGVRFLLLAGLILTSILVFFLTSVGDDIFWAYVDFTLRHGG